MPSTYSDTSLVEKLSLRNALVNQRNCTTDLLSGDNSVLAKQFTLLDKKCVQTCESPLFLASKHSSLRISVVFFEEVTTTVNKWFISLWEDLSKLFMFSIQSNASAYRETYLETSSASHCLWLLVKYERVVSRNLSIRQFVFSVFSRFHFVIA